MLEILRHCPMSRAPAPTSRVAPEASLARSLIGEAQKFPLEHRISNGAMLVGGVLSFVGTISNLALGVPTTACVLGGLGVVAYALLYAWSRCFGTFALPAILSIAGFALIYYPLLWLSNFGLSGGIYFMGLVGLVASTCIFSGRLQRGFWALFLSVTAALFVGEYLGLLPVASYEGRFAEFLDIFISFLLGGSALVALVLVLKSSQRHEHAQVVAYAQMIATTNRQLEIALEKNEQLARTDLLTNLPNRRHLDEVLARRVREAHRHGRPLSLALFDVDHFKRINDQHGHATGDAVLVSLSRCLLDQLRLTDLPARWGGEEFVVLLPETPAEGALVVAERLRHAVASHAFPEGLSVTISVGVASLREGDTEMTLLGRADSAAYQAKHRGRNRVLGE